MGTKHWTEEELKEVATNIQTYIDQNKHKQDFIFATALQPAIRKRGTTEPYDLSNPTERAAFNNTIVILKKHDVLRWRRETPNGKFVYTVNPKFLDKTGVVTHIPEPKQPKPPVVIPAAAPAVDEKKIRAQAVAFIEEEMKKIKLQEVRFGKGGSANMLNFTADIDMYDVTLYDVYKIGLATVSTVGLDTRLKDITKENDDSEEETEPDTAQTSSNQFEFDQTETDSELPF